MAESKIELLHIAREQFKDSVDNSSDNREREVDDLNFLNGDQWPGGLRSSREEDGRPCLTINKLPAFVDQVVGDQRQNRPSIKVRPVDSIADPDTAEVLTGHIRNIEQTSQADVAYDTAFESAASCGEGYFRIITEYTDDDVFEQDIKIKRIANPFTVHFDPMAQEIDLSDGKYLFVTDWVTRDEFKKKWPKHAPIEWEKAPEDTKDWVLKDRVRIAEWFRKEPITKTIWKVADGQVIDSTVKDENNQYVTKEKLETDGIEILAEREVKTDKIVWRKLSGNAILEGPQDWAGKYYPIIPVWGKEMNIEGKRIIRGVVRHAKDPQRLYNYNRSHNAEAVSLAPKVPFLATPKQIEGHEEQWKMANKANFPYLLYNVDPTAKGPPQRNFPNQLQTGIQNEVIVADQEINDTTSIPKASLGERTNEKSGKAIIARQREGDVGSFAYIDNLARALTYAGKVLVDLIPRIYDTERSLRLLGEDGSVRSVQVAPGASPQKEGKDRIYDITTGKYDVTVTVGPSYSTQRQESADSMMGFLGTFKEAAPLIGDLIAKNMDWPGAQEISDRLKKMLPPGMAEQEPDETGAAMPPEAMGPQGPPPAQQAAAETMMENEVETAEVKLEQEKVKLAQEKAKLEGLDLDNKKKEVEIKNERKNTPSKKTNKD